ncbi:MAG: hypothetical protein QOI76_357 [Frankiales bacterium]|nr:hypothetical protein [Frankiales bacterium]
MRNAVPHKRALASAFAVTTLLGAAVGVAAAARTARWAAEMLAHTQSGASGLRETREHIAGGDMHGAVTR